MCEKLNELVGLVREIELAEAIEKRGRLTQHTECREFQPLSVQ